MELQSLFFVRLSGPEYALAAAESTLREAGFGVQRLSERGAPPREVWISAERHLEGSSRIDESALAIEARDAARAVLGHEFHLREYGTALRGALGGSAEPIEHGEPDPPDRGAPN
jgi:hypothetical protein